MACGPTTSTRGCCVALRAMNASTSPRRFFACRLLFGFALSLGTREVFEQRVVPLGSSSGTCRVLLVGSPPKQHGTLQKQSRRNRDARREANLASMRVRFPRKRAYRQGQETARAALTPALQISRRKT